MDLPAVDLPKVTVVADLAATGGPIAHYSDASGTLSGLLAELLPLCGGDDCKAGLCLEHRGVAATTEVGWRPVSQRALTADRSAPADHKTPA